MDERSISGSEAGAVQKAEGVWGIAALREAFRSDRRFPHAKPQSSQRVADGRACPFRLCRPFRLFLAQPNKWLMRKLLISLPGKDEAEGEEGAEVGGVQGGEGLPGQHGGRGNEAVRQGAGATSGSVEESGSEDGRGFVHGMDAMKDRPGGLLLGREQRAAEVLRPCHG